MGGDGIPARYRTALHWVLPVAPLLGVATFFLLGAGDQTGLPPVTAELSIWKVLLATQVVVWTVLAGIGVQGLGRLDARMHAYWPEGFLARRGRRWR